MTAGGAVVTLGHSGDPGNNEPVQFGDSSDPLRAPGSGVGPRRRSGGVGHRARAGGSTGFSTGPHRRFEVDHGCPAVVVLELAGLSRLPVARPRSVRWPRVE